MSELKLIIPLTLSYDASIMDLEVPQSITMAAVQPGRVSKTLAVEVLSSDKRTVSRYEFVGRLSRPITQRMPTEAELEFAKAMVPALDELQKDPQPGAWP